MIILNIIWWIFAAFVAIKFVGIALSYVSYGIDKLKIPRVKKKWVVIEEKKDEDE